MAAGTVASNLMSELIAVPIGDERVTADDEMVVAIAVHDGAEIGQVPSCGATQVDRAVAAAKARLAEPLPAHERARSSTGLPSRWPSARRTLPAPSLRRRPSHPHRPYGGRPGGRRSASAPSRPAASRARWSPSTPAFRDRKARLHVAGAGGGGRRHQPVQLSPQPREPQGGARHRRRLPRGAEARQPDAAVRPGAGAHAVGRCGLPPGWLNVVTGSRSSGGRPSGHAPRRRCPHHLHRFPRGGLGHP